MQETDLLGALRSFSENGIDCVLVGGLASVLNGAPTATYDVDVVFSRDPENLAHYFQLARNSVLRGKIPMLFFDEFDCTVGDFPFFWLLF